MTEHSEIAHSSCHTYLLPRQASFAKEIAIPQNCDDCFLSLLGQDGELDLAFFDIENGVGRFALNKNAVVGTVFGTRLSAVGLGQ